MVDLSIIIASFNNVKLLTDCINSIINSTKKITYEIIVVDNASSDNSANIIKSIFKKVKMIENKENVGFAKANNQGLRLANGKYPMLLNNDTVVLDGAFDKMFEYMDDHPKVGAIGPAILNTDHTPQRQWGVLGSKFWRSEKIQEVNFVLGACIMVRRTVIEEIGPLDENFLLYNEDLDWCKRIKKAGWKIIFCPEAKVIHYGGYSSTRIFNQKLFIEGFRGGLYFCKKHYGNLAYHIYRVLLPIGLLALGLTWVITFTFKSKEKKKEYPQKFASLWEILKINLFGQIIPPKTI